MSTTINQRVLQIGFLGFGEVGYTFAQGLKNQSACKVYAYDVSQDLDWQGKLIQERAKDSGTKLVSGPEDLASLSDIIIAIVPAKFAVSAAQSISSFLKKEKAYCDLGSASPEKKEEVAVLIEQNGASFVDGAIMGSMALYGFKAPILVAGPSAAEWASKLHSVGFNIQCVGEQVGAASTTKMLRSVFTKGLEALVVETFYAASILGVENLIQDVLANTFDNETFAESVTRYLTSDAIHATRRIAEVEDVISVLKGLGVDPIMTEATMRRLRWSASLKLNEHFKGVTPKSGKEVLKAMLKAEGN